jgi:hypothetical protein
MKNLIFLAVVLSILALCIYGVGAISMPAVNKSAMVLAPDPNDTKLDQLYSRAEVAAMQSCGLGMTVVLGSIIGFGLLAAWARKK